jgi:hypothetical protein
VLTPALDDAAAPGAPLAVLDADASPRCRQPVALIAPCCVVAMPRWPGPCGVLVAGDWAARTPHNAMLPPNVSAHCDR